MSESPYEMIERVANAILQAEAQERGIPASWSDLPDELQNSLRLQACAAIAAMRIPSDAMEDAGETARDVDGWGVAATYTAMINAALRPEA